MFTVQAVLTNLLIGMSAGMMNYLTASGMSLIVAGMGTVNFGQGAFYIVGAYICYYATSVGIPFLLALGIGFLVPGILGALLELLIRPLHGKDMTFIMLITLGFASIVCDLLVMICGYTVRATPLPEFLRGAIQIPGMNYSFPTYYVFTIFFALLIGAIFLLAFRYTKIGMYFRAIISDRAMVENLGINVNKVFMMMFIIGTGLGGLAGALNAPIQGISPKAGLTILAQVMPALQLGGMGNIKACLPASIILGVITGIAAMVIPLYYNVAASAVMVVFMFFKPRGLFAKKEA